MKYNIQLALMIMILISLSLPILIGYILVSYIKSLEDKKCACSNDRRRKYIKFYGYFVLNQSFLNRKVVFFCTENDNPKKVFKNCVFFSGVWLTELCIQGGGVQG